MSMLGLRQTLLLVQQTGCDCPLARTCTCSFLQVTTQWNQTTCSFMPSFAWLRPERLLEWWILYMYGYRELSL